MKELKIFLHACLIFEYIICIRIIQSFVYCKDLTSRLVILTLHIENFGYCKKSSFAFLNQISCWWYCVLSGKHQAFVCMLSVVIKPAWLTRENQNQKMKLLVAFLASAFAEEPLQRSRRQVKAIIIVLCYKFSNFRLSFYPNIGAVTTLKDSTFDTIF